MGRPAPRTTWVIALSVVSTLAACTESRDSGTSGATAAYTAGDNDPAVCVEFEDVSPFLALPAALATLSNDPNSTNARAVVGDAAEKADDISDAANGDASTAGIATIAGSLAEQLEEFDNQSPTTESLTEVSTTLYSLGARVQEVCGLPT